MNLPNRLTLIRIFLIPLLVALIVTRFDRFASAAVFALAGITDWLDGYVARSKRLETDLGKILDPIADKLLISAAFISLVETGMIPAWMVVVVIGREFAVSALRGIAATKNVIIAANKMGKIKTVVQIITIFTLILKIPHIQNPVFNPLLWVMLLITVVSGLRYIIEFWSVVDIKTY